VEKGKGRVLLKGVRGIGGGVGTGGGESFFGSLLCRMRNTRSPKGERSHGKKLLSAEQASIRGAIKGARKSGREVRLSAVPKGVQSEEETAGREGPPVLSVSKELRSFKPLAIDLLSKDFSTVDPSSSEKRAIISGGGFSGKKVFFRSHEDSGKKNVVGSARREGLTGGKAWQPASPRSGRRDTLSNDYFEKRRQPH